MKSPALGLLQSSQERARIFQVAGENLIQRELRPLDVLGIEFYGQGEVAQLAGRVDEQLRLIEREP